jgi:DNA replication protein DnaC
MEDEWRWEARQRSDACARLRRSGISERALDAWYRGLQETPATKSVETFLDSGKTFLLLLGSPGAGKTLATTHALAHHGGTFVRAVELARLSQYETNDRAQLESAHKVGLLVIDDLGAELLHDGWRPMLDELIDVRWGARRKTILTTNLDAGTFKTRYGARIADRIRDDGFVEKCGDQSRRGGKSQ